MNPQLFLRLAHEFKAHFKISSASPGGFCIFGNSEVELSRVIFFAFTTNVGNVIIMIVSAVNTSTLLNPGVVLCLLFISEL
jgi:hypothetical protein